jgi:hypothetical protein
MYISGLGVGGRYSDGANLQISVVDINVDGATIQLCAHGPDAFQDEGEVACNDLGDSCNDWAEIGYCFPGTVRVFRQKFTLEDAIGPHASSLEALAGV